MVNLKVMKRKLSLLTLTLAPLLIGAGCDMPDANFTAAGTPTIIKVERYGNNPEKANFTISTGVNGYNRTVTILLPVKSGRVGDVLIAVSFSSPKIKAEDESKP
jgi:hypothetical protein